MAYGLNPLYVTGPDLNQYLVDKTTGAPLSGGSIYFYEDTNRTTLKDVFQLTQLSSSPPNYSYTALSNPVILSGVGTIVDTNGNQIALYYYPYDNLGAMQLYYIEVYDANGLLQFTREAWPYPNLGIGGGGGSGTINLAAANSVAYYATTGTTISGVAPAANSILATTNSGVPLMTQAMPSAVQVSTGSLNNGTSASNTTFWRGDGTWATPPGSSSTLARAWSLIDSTAATASIVNSFNIASATYNGVGDITLTFTAAMPSANYVAAAISGKGASGFGGSVAYIEGPITANPTTTAYRYQTVGSTGASNESPFGQLIFFGS